MKYLKYFNNHNIRESFQETNTDNTLVHYCEDKNHLHYRNCNQNVEPTPDSPAGQNTEIIINGVTPIDILESMISTWNVSGVNYVDENLNYIKQYYNIPFEGESIFDENPHAEYPSFGGTEQNIVFPDGTPNVVNFISVNDDTEYSCSGFGLAEYYNLSSSIQGSNILSNIVNYNSPISLEFDFNSDYMVIKLAPVAYGTTYLEGSQVNVLFYMTIPESISSSNDSYWIDVPPFYGMRIAENLQVILPFQEFKHTHSDGTYQSGSGGSYFDPPISYGGGGPS